MKLKILLLMFLAAEANPNNTKCKTKGNILNNTAHIHKVSNLHMKTQKNYDDHFTQFGPRYNNYKKSEKINNTVTSQSSKDKSANPCPEGFETYDSTRPVCYVITESQPFPPKCPYPNYLSASSYLGYIVKELDIWMTAVRNTKDGFGPFERTEHDRAYGETIDVYFAQHENITEKNCLIIRPLIIGQKQFVPVNCNEKHRALCVYPYSTFEISKYCHTHYGKANSDRKCIADSINIEHNRCYCEGVKADKIYKQNVEGTRDLFCNILAEPISAFQNHLLMTQLPVTNNKCWFGLHNKDGMPKWTISDTKINYTNWATHTNFSKPFGAIQFLDNPGWTLADDDGTISCGVCEFQNVYDKNVSIKLKYNPLNHAVEVRVKNPFELSDLFGHNFELYMFLGPTTNAFKQRLRTYYDFGNIEKSEEYTENIDVTWKIPIYYWCEGFQHPNYTPVRSNKLLVQTNNGEQEYAIQVMVRTEKNRDPYLDKIHENAKAYILENTKLPNMDDTLRVMKVLKFDQDHSYIDMIMHLTTEKVENEQAEFEYLQRCFNELSGLESSPFLNVTRFGRCDVCLPSTTLSGNKTLNWPKTIIEAITLSKEVCLQDNGNPVMRKCEGDFWQGGVWSEAIGNCSDDMHLSERTQELNDLLNNENITANELSENLLQITENNTDITTVDVYLISEILEKLEAFEDGVNTTDVVTIISNVMDFEPKELKRAQEILNSTDKILSSLDKILTKYNVDHGDYTYQVVVSKRVLVQSNDVRKTNITGVALNSSSENTNFDTYKLIPIYKNTSIEELLKEKIELAAFLPKNLLLELENCLTNENSIKLIMALFYNDVLFNDNVEKNHQTNSRILSVLIPNFFCTFSTPIPIIFRPLHNLYLKEKCVHWNYGMDENMESNIQGHWTEDSIPKSNTNRKYSICKFDHLTHFALLMMSNSVELSKENTLALDIITAVGSILSLTSILAMFVMAIIYKNWRSSYSNKIILNFSVAIALQINFLYIANNIQKDGIWCTVTGASLHYTILSEFCWMLIIAILQYRKFVIVFRDHIPKFVAKACAFCWCVPLIPVALLLAISNGSYHKNKFGLCYPSGKYFYFGVVLPIAVIWLLNFLVFVKIIFAVCHKKVKAYGQKQDESKLQIILALFLFFMLGICWIFGIAVGFGGRIWYSYLFCFTATFQGFVIFIFFIVMNVNSKKL